MDENKIDILNHEKLKERLLQSKELERVTKFHKKISAGIGTDVNQRGKELLKRNIQLYSSLYKSKDLGGRSGIRPISFCEKPPFFSELMRQPASLLENRRESRVSSTNLNQTYSK